MREKMKQTREQVYQFTRERLLAGNPPTVREVQHAIGLKAVESARQHLDALVTEGKLIKAPGLARGYRLVEMPAELLARVTRVPILGRVQAGVLTLASEDREGEILVEGMGEGLFALRVRGESMSGAGIFQGDLVIVRQQGDAEDGAIVVALVDDEATVKRLRKRRDRVELHPENPSFEPIIPEGPWSLLGKVIEVRRTLE